MKILVTYTSYNVAQKFKKAIWRKRSIYRIFDSVKDAKKNGIKLNRSLYFHLDNNENVVKCFNNLK